MLTSRLRPLHYSAIRLIVLSLLILQGVMAWHHYEHGPLEHKDTTKLCELCFFDAHLDHAVSPNTAILFCLVAVTLSRVFFHTQGRIYSFYHYQLRGPPLTLQS